MLSRDIAQILLQEKAVQISLTTPFIWSSGLKSPIYCDNRLSLSFPQVRTFLKKSLVDATRLFPEFDRVAGVATAGFPHGMLVADVLVFMV